MWCYKQKNMLNPLIGDRFHSCKAVLVSLFSVLINPETRIQVLLQWIFVNLMALMGPGATNYFLSHSVNQDFTQKYDMNFFFWPKYPLKPP